MLSEIIVEGKDHIFDLTITQDGIPIDRIENTATVSIKRLTDSSYWNVDSGAWEEGEVFNAVDNTQGSGLYLLIILASSDFFEDLSPLTEYDIMTTWHVEDSDEVTVYEASTIRTIAKGTPIYKQDIVDALSLIPTEEAPAPTSIQGMIEFNKRIERCAYEYDFATYSKAVMLFYEEDRSFSGDPYAWCYLYTATGTDPVNVSEISKRDRVRLWTEAEPV